MFCGYASWRKPRSFYKRPNVIKFKELLSTDNVKDLIQLSKFVDIIMKKFSSVI